MDEIEYIAEGLKALNNAAVSLVLKGDYEGAEKMFRSVEEMAMLFCYEEGVGMTRVSMANLSMARGNIMDALAHIEAAIGLFPPGDDRDAACDMQKKISLHALESGMEKERAGDLKGALEMFETILPILNEKRAELVAAEIENIKRYLESGSE